MYQVSTFSYAPINVHGEGGRNHPLVLYSPKTPSMNRVKTRNGKMMETMLVSYSS